MAHRQCADLAQNGYTIQAVYERNALFMRIHYTERLLTRSIMFSHQVSMCATVLSFL